MSQSEHDKVHFTGRDAARLARDYAKPVDNRFKQKVLEKVRTRSAAKPKERDGRTREMQ